MSFYITLPSNGADLTSDYGKMVNRQSDFYTDLIESINLGNSNFEVALVECSFRKNWKNDVGGILLLKYDESGHKIVKFKMLSVTVCDGIKMSSLIKTINSLIEISVTFNTEDFKFILNDVGTLEIKIKENFGLKINGYLATLLQNFVVVRKDEKLIDFASTFFTSSDKISDSSIPESGLKTTKDLFHEYYTSKLGVSKNTVMLNSDKIFKTEFRGLNEYLKYTEEIFVYTNIIKPTFVGNGKVKLLKIITDDSVYDKIVSLNYSAPHYMPLESRLLDRIRLFMLDSQGNKIKFSDSHSRVIYKLHFREV